MELAAIIIPLVIASIVLLAWWLDVRTPRTVRWRDEEVDGVAAQVANGLVLQHDDGSSVWASRGYSIYRSIDGAAFRRVARIRPPWGEAWGGYSAALRRRFGYQELVEVVPLEHDPGVLVVFAGGYVHRVDLGSRVVERTHQLRYFGRGKGRGLMAFGVTSDLDGALYYAEYVTESGERPTGIWRSQDDGRTWHAAYEFAADAIRHVHVIQCDPHDGALWIGTGDRDEHCFVGVSRDGAASFEWVGQGRQIHRTCSFAMFDDVVAWPMDADFEQNHVVRWHRGSGDVTVDGTLPDASYCARRIDEERFVAGVCQGVAAAWVCTRSGAARPWVAWPVPDAPPVRGPSPGVRLARGPVMGGARSAEQSEAGMPQPPTVNLPPAEYVLLNPLRTLTHEAAIYRISTRLLPPE